jgi:hypothetical protein
VGSVSSSNDVTEQALDECDNLSASTGGACGELGQQEELHGEDLMDIPKPGSD